MSLVKTMTCVVVDDERSSIQVLEKYIHKVPFLSLVATCDNAIESLKTIQQLKPDILFLDVEMPGIDGFELLTLLPSPRPSVIMVTASPAYAVDGFAQEVTDYLLKPFPFDRFVKAVKRCESQATTKFADTNHSGSSTDFANTPKVSEFDDRDVDFLMVRENKKIIRINPLEIQVVEGMRDYLKVYLDDRVAVLHITMTKIEARLPALLFFRVHKSFIVNKSFIKEIDGNELVLTSGKRILIGPKFRAELLNSLQKNFL